MGLLPAIHAAAISLGLPRLATAVLDALPPGELVSAARLDDFPVAGSPPQPMSGPSSCGSSPRGDAAHDDIVVLATPVRDRQRPVVGALPVAEQEKNDDDDLVTMLGLPVKASSLQTESEGGRAPETNSAQILPSEPVFVVALATDAEAWPIRPPTPS
jgi:hypothetical protein